MKSKKTKGAEPAHYTLRFDGHEPVVLDGFGEMGPMERVMAIGDAVALRMGASAGLNYAMATAAHLDALPAPNHCAWAMTFPASDGRPARTLDLVAQWSDGETTVAKIGRLTQERDALRSLLAAAARGELPRCDCWHGCSRIAAQEATEGETAWSCDECLAKHERAADRRARAGWRDLPHDDALRAATGGGA